MTDTPDFLKRIVTNQPKPIGFSGLYGPDGQPLAATQPSAVPAWQTHLLAAFGEEAAQNKIAAIMFNQNMTPAARHSMAMAVLRNEARDYYASLTQEQITGIPNQGNGGMRL